MEKGEVAVVKNTGQRSPWGQAPSVTPCSLTSVMDEEIAKDLQKEENKRAGFSVQPVEEPFEANVEATGGSETDNDLLLAQMLQHQFDAENDKILNLYEQKYNGCSKVSVSFENYRAVHPALREDSSSSDELEDWFEEDPPPVSDKAVKVAPSGKKEIITKHDQTVCGRKNVKMMEKFPPGFAAGDVGNQQLDLKLSNSVFNTLKQHMYREERQSHRLHEKKEHSTHEQALDPKTRLLLYKMVNGEILEAVNGCISTGKEACVFHANGASTEDGSVPAECAVKVYKTTLNEFKTRERYIKDDHRFRARFSKQNPRKVIRLWAEKEMCNLSRLEKAGVPCPSVVLLKKHILVMSFIGRDQKPAPKLKDATLSARQWQQAYHQCVQMMQTMYQQCRLVHADLSEYNMLWHDAKVWFIDVSQSVEPHHPHALEFLYRDCTNVVQFFRNMGVADLVSARELFLKVSQLDISADEERDFLTQIQNFETHEMTLGGRKNEQPYEFDYYFTKTSQSKRQTTVRSFAIVRTWEKQPSSSTLAHPGTQDKEKAVPTSRVLNAPSTSSRPAAIPEGSDGDNDATPNPAEYSPHRSVVSIPSHNSTAITVTSPRASTLTQPASPGLGGPPDEGRTADSQPIDFEILQAEVLPPVSQSAELLMSAANRTPDAGKRPRYTQKTPHSGPGSVKTAARPRRKQAAAARGPSEVEGGADSAELLMSSANRTPDAGKKPRYSQKTPHSGPGSVKPAAHPKRKRAAATRGPSEVEGGADYGEKKFVRLFNADQGRSKRVSEITDLDVVLTSIEEVALEYRNEVQTSIGKQVVKEFFIQVRKVLTDSIDICKERQLLKSELRKVKAKVTKHRKELLSVEQQRSRVKAQLEKFTAQHHKKQSERQEALQEISTFLTDLEVLERQSREERSSQSSFKDYASPENLPGLLSDGCELAMAGDHLKAINNSLELWLSKSSDT